MSVDKEAKRLTLDKTFTMRRRLDKLQKDLVVILDLVGGLFLEDNLDLLPLFEDGVLRLSQARDIFYEAITNTKCKETAALKEEVSG